MNEYKSVAKKKSENLLFFTCFSEMNSFIMSSVDFSFQLSVVAHM
jgi:hypothetical protein